MTAQASDNMSKELENMTPQEKIAYNMGIVLANDMKSAGISDVDPAIVNQAIKDFMANKPKMDVASAQKAVQEYKLESVKRVGKEFLVENAKKSGVTTLPSGLQYSVMNEGNGGAKPGPTSKVTTHYHGTLIDGTVFDSSVDRGEPISFPVNGVIKGWTEALQLMSPGDKWKLYIPENLAYGARGAGGVIKPYATLVFEVELISFQ
jgi:FKBP-type peptidyl-prolyl cis-trans isomerase FklB